MSALEDIANKPKKDSTPLEKVVWAAYWENACLDDDCEQAAAELARLQAVAEAAREVLTNGHERTGQWWELCDHDEALDKLAAALKELE